MQLPAPRVLPDGCLFGGRWRIVRCLRAGGMGAVYEVVHRETRARSALKVMLPDLVLSGELRERFRQEAMVTATIESDHVVKVFDGGTDGETGSPYLVMELLRGDDLGSRIAQTGALSAPEVVLLLTQVALALDRTHAAGVVHRDLKPENVFVTTRDDGSKCVKVLDFGIAKIVAQSASKAETTRTLGTPLYMAPEQVRGDGTIGPAADLHALGHIAYTLLVGEPYWAQEKRGHESVYPLLMAITEGTKDPATIRSRASGVELPPAFDAWFAKATALVPEHRFASAREIVRELALALDVEAPRAVAEPAGGEGDDPRPAAERRSTRPRIAATGLRSTLGVAAIVATLLGVVYAARVRADGSPRAQVDAAPARESSTTPAVAPRDPEEASAVVPATTVVTEVPSVEPPAPTTTAEARAARAPHGSGALRGGPPSRRAKPLDPAPAQTAEPSTTAPSPPAPEPAPPVDPSDLYRKSQP